MSRAHGFSSYSAYAGRLFRACVLLEHVGEEQHLVLHCVAPIRPVVRARALMEVVWNAFFEQFFMQGAVDSEEKIVGAAVEYDLQRVGAQHVGHVDNRVAFPVFGMFLDSAQPLRYSQFIGKGRMSTPPDMLPAAANKS